MFNKIKDTIVGIYYFIVLILIALFSKDVNDPYR